MFDDPSAALAQVRAIYDDSIRFLRESLQRFVEGETPAERRARLLPVRAGADRDRCARRFAPVVRLLSPAPGAFETTLTRPRPVRGLLHRTIPPAADKPWPAADAARSGAELAADPDPLLLRRARSYRGQPERRAPHADARCIRPAQPGCHGRRHCQRHFRSSAGAKRSRCRCLPHRASIIRCSACATTTGTSPEHFQNFVMFTNYQFYIDEFVRLGHELMASPDNDGYVALRRTGQYRLRAGSATPCSPATTWAPHRHACRRCLATNLVRADGSRPSAW